PALRGPQWWRLGQAVRLALPAVGLAALAAFGFYWLNGLQVLRFAAFLLAGAATAAAALRLFLPLPEGPPSRGPQLGQLGAGGLVCLALSGLLDGPAARLTAALGATLRPLWDAWSGLPPVAFWSIAVVAFLVFAVVGLLVAYRLGLLSYGWAALKNEFLRKPPPRVQARDLVEEAWDEARAALAKAGLDNPA